MEKAIVIATSILLIAGCGTTVSVPKDNDPEVNIGYSTVKKSDLTSSVTSLQVDESQIRSYTNIYDYIQGRVPGLTVLPNHHILIRGVNSINSGTDPLIIVDGTEIAGDLSFLNPSDIKSIDVIKDGSASIYGVRGANGVIIITTRR